MRQDAILSIFFTTSRVKAIKIKSQKVLSIDSGVKNRCMWYKTRIANKSPIYT